MKIILTLIILCGLGTETLFCQNNPINKQKVRSAPDWIINGVIYQIQLRSYTSEGTINSATEQLLTVAELGVNIIYLCPVFVADDGVDTLFWSPRQKASGLNNPHNPYRIKDYFHVDPEYGTEEDLKNFVSEAHKLGMRVMFDLVYRHCGPNAVFINDYPDFVKRDSEGKFITNNYNWPSLNFDNAELREYLYSNMEYLVNEFDVDGFRFDSVLGFPSDIPLDFLERARERLEKIRPDIAMLAESRGRPEDQLKAFDINYPPGTLLNWNNIEEIKENWNRIKNKYPIGFRFIRFIENHDVAHNGGMNRIEKSWGFQKINVGLVAIFTFDGVPFVYNGQEIADTARHNIFGPGFSICWANAETPTGQKRFNFLQRLCEIRKTETALTHGELEWLDNDTPKAILSFLRILGNEQILIVMNLTDSPQKINIPGLKYLNNKSFQTLLVEGTTGNHLDGFDIEGLGFLIAKIK